MALFVSFVARSCLGYDPEDYQALSYVSEKGLTEEAREMKSFLRRAGDSDGALYFRKNAAALGRIALKKEREEKTEVVAVLFRDCDGTRSASPGLWESKRQSVLNGFAAAGFSRGVAMIPKPKSEAWILCAVRGASNEPYQDCGRLEEELSGNDRSCRSPKVKLEEALGVSPGREALVELVRDGTVDPLKIKMPSFNAFRADLEEVLRKVLPSQGQ
ncbi:hypothetical protein [Aminirod propionatiphilus]|uniref:Uncharacterized protein n=1 Tax=Aminirod propionatiphilus TaxID=3415223 RepID=A0ACD1DXY1_9BACT|nr:hypothetical protein KIH16_03335 [Synergistota bacterium]